MSEILVPSNSEVFGIVQDMFGDCVKSWDMDELRWKVKTMQLNCLVDYPENVTPLLLWIKSQRV